MKLWTSKKIKDSFESYRDEAIVDRDDIEYWAFANVSGVHKDPSRCQNPNKNAYYDSGEAPQADDLVIFMFWTQISEEWYYIDITDEVMNLYGSLCDEIVEELVYGKQ